MPAEKTPTLINLGCRLNHYETSYIATILKSLKMQDKFALVNTCAITNESEKQSRQEVRKLKRENPHLEIIVTGCASNLQAEKFRQMPEVFCVISNDMKKEKSAYNKILDFYKKKQEILKDNIQKEEKHLNIEEQKEEEKEERTEERNIEEKNMQIQKLKTELDIYLFSQKEKNEIDEEDDTIYHLYHESPEEQKRSRIFVEIQNGCNHYCSFCIVPFTRGKMKSRPIEEILEEIKIISENNFNEIVLTGVDITDYGTDNGRGERKLSLLCEKILQETSIKRLRLSSVDVAELDEKFMQLFIDFPNRFMPYFHISLQSGNNEILKKMRRRHLRENVIDFCKKVRQINPETTIGGDIITGFCGETEEQFNDSLNLVNECFITFIHAFPYSKKEKTLASKWPDLIAKEVKKERVHKLIDAGKRNLIKLYQSMLNKDFEIILERTLDCGKAPNFATIYLDKKLDIQPGAIIKVKCDKIDFDNEKLFGYVL